MTKPQAAWRVGIDAYYDEVLQTVSHEGRAFFDRLVAACGA